MPNQYFGMSLEALHYLLWHRRMSGDQVRIVQKTLAEELNVSRQRVTQVLGELEEAGRLTRTAQKSVYLVADPAAS